MGRHGAGPASRTRVSGPVVAICLLVLAAVGFGFWLWTIRSVDDPVNADPVDAYAVVVSSPSCTAGSGSTVIDLTLSTPVRSSFSACGRRVGERVAVQYLAGHPDQVRLAGTAVARNNSARGWLPFAILGAGLLAVIGTLSLLVDRHRSRHEARTGSEQRLTVAQLREAAEAANGRSMTPGAPEVESPDTTTRITAAAMPGMAPPVRPSDIAVDEDLFTHRGHS